MEINFNGDLLQAMPGSMSELIRATQYGDSLFETIRMSGGAIPFLEKHIARLKKGLTALGMNIEEHWNTQWFEKEINKTVSGNARIRLMVFRKPGGLYLPENNDAGFMITAAPLSGSWFEWPEQPIVAGICEKVKLPVDDFSNFKTLNAPRYVQAAMEARSKGWQDGILLNQFGRVCEATSSNIFWWDENGVLHSPPLSEGCVAGIMREHLFETALKNGIVVRETAAAPEILETAKENFFTNAIRGIVPVQLAGKPRAIHRKTRELFDLTSHSA